jgi:autotransporter-associated beta strand protein
MNVSRWLPHAALIVTTLFATAWLPAPAMAQTTVTWTTGSSSVLANWSAGALPGVNDTVVVGGGGASSVTLNSALSFKTWTWGGNGNGALTIVNGGALTIDSGTGSAGSSFAKSMVVSQTDSTANLINASSFAVRTLSVSSTSSSQTANFTIQSGLSVVANGGVSPNGSVSIATTANRNGTLTVSGSLTGANTIALGASTTSSGSATLVLDGGYISGANSVYRDAHGSVSLQFKSGTYSGSGVQFYSNSTSPLDIALGSSGSRVVDTGNGLITVMPTARFIDLTTLGSLTKNGTGTLVLQGTNTYTGDTVIRSGTLRVENVAQQVLSGTVGGTGNRVISGLTSTAGLFIGQAVTGSGITANAYITALTGTSVTVSGSGTPGAVAATFAAANGTLEGTTLNYDNQGGVLSFGQSTALALGGLKGSQNLGLANAANAAVALTLGGNNQSTTYSGTLSGSGSLTKAGSGGLTLGATNTYSGATTVSAGRLEIGSGGSINGTIGITLNGSGAEFKYNSATALTKPLTLTQGVLSGTGTIGAAVSVGSNAVLSPGNSPGSQAFTQGLTFAPGGQYTWEINDWAGSPGTGYDQLVVSGSALNITATSGSTFTIAITGLTAGNVAGVVPGFPPGTTGTSFTIATAAAGISGFEASKFTVDRSGFTNTNTLPANAGFWLTTNAGSTSLMLNYAPSATFNLAATASNSAIRVGGTSWITATVTSSTAAVTNPDSVAYGGLALSGGLGSLSSTSGTLAGGLSSSGSSAFTTLSTGSYAFTPSVTSAMNVNIGTAANAGSTSGVTVTVWNPAAANSISGTLSLGTVLKGATLSQALSLQNTAPNGGFSEKLDVRFGTLSGVTTNSGSISLLTPQATDGASMVVGFSTATAGAKTGSADVNFWTDGQGTSGLAPLQLASQTVSLTGTVLDPALASFASGSAATTELFLDFGAVNQNASVSPLGFSLYNLMQTSGYTADLALLNIVSGTGNTNAITTTLPNQFSNLTSGSVFAYSASLSTASLGAFQNVYMLQFKSANNGTAFGSDATQSLTLTVQGVIIVPEPGTLTLVGIGAVVLGWAAVRRVGRI